MTTSDQIQFWQMIATWVAALVATLAALFAWLVGKKQNTLNERFGRIQEEPQLDIFIEQGEEWGSMLYLVIKNTGQGGAYDIKLKTDQEFFCMNKAEMKLSEQGPFKNGISFLPPNGSRKLFLGSFIGDEFKKLIDQKLTIEAEYKNINCSPVKRKFSHDFSDLENTFLPPPNPLFQISKSLEEISKNIKDVASGWHKLRVITKTHLEEEKSIRDRLAQKPEGDKQNKK